MQLPSLYVLPSRASSGPISTMTSASSRSPRALRHRLTESGLTRAKLGAGAGRVLGPPTWF